MNLTENAHTVLDRRYLRRDASGRVLETPGELFERVSRAVASADALYPSGDPSDAFRRFHARLTALEFLPNSPTLMNAGRDGGQLAACFVLPVEDSIEGIFDAVKWAAKIQMTGGGTGFSFSRLRPAGDLVASTKGVASGPVSFMEVFNAATDAIKQGGMRRGANMGMLRVDHPDIFEFISCKLDRARMKNFNLSVAITDVFMAALRGGGSYPLRNPRSQAVVGRLDAWKVMDLICEIAWSCAEPGVVFIDRVNEANPTPAQGAMEATNPCAELPLLPFESCNLGSINVARFLTAARNDFDWDRLGGAIDDGVHFLDNVIDQNCYPLPEIEAATKRNRKIGLGVMGFADALIELGIGYDTPRALEVAERLSGFVRERSEEASRELARRRGVFPGFPGSRWDVPGAAPMRNATTTTVAPTGTISIIAGCSSGIEPLYAVSYVRRVLEGAELVEVHPGFAATAKERGFHSEALMRRISERGTVRGLPEVPADVQRRFVTAHDISPEQHVRVQAAFQKNVHNAISKTINLPREATVGDVAQAYLLAYDLGCKGVTVYRDGSRGEQVLSVGAVSARAEGGTAAELLEETTSCPDC